MGKGAKGAGERRYTGTSGKAFIRKLSQKLY